MSSYFPPYALNGISERGCSFCVHGRTDDGQHCNNGALVATQCRSPNVGSKPMPVSLARADTGPCGRDARHLDFAALQQAA
jgi:hypothetical protein